MIEARIALEFVEQIQVLDDPEVIVAAFQAAAGKLGYSTVALGELSAAGALPVFFISTWPQEWGETYVGEGFAAIDPSITYACAGESKDHDRVALHLMTLYLHERLTRLLAPRFKHPSSRTPQLSRGEIECICWLLAGKSDWEIGEILNIAEATAHWRIERAKRKLGVKTRAQLTAAAILNGYLRF